MSGFSPDWLELREPCDTRARSEELVIALRSLLVSRPLRVLDLGAGTGANIRYMAPLLGGEQRWCLVDNDPRLIERQPAILEGAHFQCEVISQQLDLATDLSSLPISQCQLVTASALLDLVSADWLASLASRCAALSVPVLFSLSYDGRVQCLPDDPDDEWVIGLVNRHQRGDKGFGPALGPDATRYACEVFAALGFQTRIAPSDWLIESEERAFQRELIAGWSGAAREMAPSEAARIERWSGRRDADIASGSSRIRVGHQDFMAWPTAPCE
ncbi:class I SAM-dependent methyltransferase [Steroidobacter cummioxidans]|uniref:class I SAM-dependent methyltransferase n=1 Tax=Steroidobacter cummioxidans TaxID=1803913 RepID=UPI0012906372|nr:class I SAM-dependent methyltransferase [Steroidobacter cummioxidans]